MNKVCIILLSIVCIAFPAFCAVCETETKTRELTFPEAEWATGADGLCRVSLAGLSPRSDPGRPVLPHTGVTISVPAGFSVVDVSCDEEDVYEVTLPSRVCWGQLPIGPESTLPIVDADESVYGANAFYPASPLLGWRTDPIPDGTAVSIHLSPLRVHSVHRLLRGARKLCLRVTLRPSAEVSSRKPASVRQLFAPRPPSVTNDYIILTTAELATNTPAPWNFQTLAAARAAGGFRPLVVTTEWVDEHYAGSNKAVRIRAFVQDAYRRGGLKYLLLGGAFPLLPVMKFFQIHTSYFTQYTADIPADALYYGCMDGTFDGNGNGIYGERTDGEGGGDVDLTAEVMVGRFPVETPGEVSAMVRKTLRYENAGPEELLRNAFLAEKVNFGQLIYADGFMEEIRTKSSAYGVSFTGFDTSVYADRFTYRTLYDSDAGLWAAKDALDLLNENFHTINHMGHGTAKNCMKLALTDTVTRDAVRALTNSLPSFIYSAACTAGALDIPDCFAEQLVTADNAAVGAVMNAREGWVFSGIVGGYNHNFQRAFWDAALCGKGTRFGEINEISRRANIAFVPANAESLWRWVYYELNLFGDPAMPFAKAINRAPPTFLHEPLVNTYDTENAYVITCTVEPIGIYDPAGVSLVWSAGPEMDLVHTQKMENTEGNLFRASIPPHPANTRISYRLTAKNAAGFTGYFPAEGTFHVFYVTDKLSLTVLGSPADYGTISPGYGTVYFPSGLCATVSAPATVLLTEETRMRRDGFTGTGSAPASGIDGTNTFMMRENSYFIWKWQPQNRLLLSVVPAFDEPLVLWTDNGGACEIPAIPVTVTNDVSLTFAEWTLDGEREPAAPSNSSPDFGRLTMDVPHKLTARYLPTDEDADKDGIPDWYELRYYGSLLQDAESDTDEDGYSLADEFSDRSHPLDAASYPDAPVIVFTPLEETQTTAGPYCVRATITDTYRVEHATLCWRRAGGEWEEVPMVGESNGLYRAEFAKGSLPMEEIEYLIEADDPNGMLRRTDTFFLFTVFPMADFSPMTNRSFTAFVTSPANAWTNRIVNRGNATLTGTVALARCDAIRNTALPNWDLVSIDQSWEISTNRFFSPPYALHIKTDSSKGGGKAVHATITFPPCRIGKDAVLSFAYWINAETDSKEPSRAFDCGIVEYSLDGGRTFTHLPGPYTHTVYGWENSPWTNGVPCFAGESADGWRRVRFSLAGSVPALDGLYGENVLFRFHYGADNNTDREGWYIDDLAVYPLLSEPSFGLRDGTYFPFSIDAGRYRTFSGYNLPALAVFDDNTVTPLFLSNDAYQPFYTFDWRLLIAYPSVSLGIVVTTDRQITMSWPTETGYRYTLESTPSLLPAEWEPVTDVTELPGDGSVFSYLQNTTNAPSLFMRVRVTR